MGSFVVAGVAPVADLSLGADWVCRGAGFAVSGRFSGRLAPPPYWVEWFWLVRSVGLAFATAAGPGGLVEWSVVQRLTEMDLPRIQSSAFGVPGVQADEVVPDESDGEEQCGRDEPGLSEEAAVDAEALVAVGADESFDEGAPVERQGPARRLP